MWKNSHFAKERLKQDGFVFAFTFSFLKLAFCTEMKHVYCVWDYSRFRFFINVITKSLDKSCRKLRDYHEYQRKRLFSVLAHDLEGCNLKVFSLEQSWGS